MTALTGDALLRAVADDPGNALSGAYVYLIHFDRPYAHARHYTGWTRDLPQRIADHRAGKGARLLAVIAAAGIGWELARVWPATRQYERCLKRQGGAGRRCPLCGITPRNPWPPRQGLVT